MMKVGLLGVKEGWLIKDVIMVIVLKGQGYFIGQFGKNYQGDCDEYLLINYGFDEFLGNFYYLNVEEELEQEDYL